MNKSVLLHSLIMLSSVLVSCISQVILKKSSQKKRESFIKEYLNFPTIFAYSLFFFATLISIFAYKVIPLTLGVVLDSASYIFITIFGVIIFKEKTNKMKLLAILMIVSGIIVYSLP